ADPIVPPKIGMKLVLGGKNQIPESVKKGRDTRNDDRRHAGQSVTGMGPFLRLETLSHHSCHGKDTRNSRLSEDAVGKARLGIDQGNRGAGEKLVRRKRNLGRLVQQNPEPRIGLMRLWKDLPKGRQNGDLL